MSSRAGQSTSAVNHEGDQIERETRCDFFGWSPAWMQKLANIKMYILVYGLVGVVESSVGSYYVATVTTIEKRFKLPSRISGLMLSGWDIGSVCSIFFLAYLGSSGRKPRWVACGTLIASFVCISNVIPHILYGAGEDASALALGEYELNQTGSQGSKIKQSESCFKGSHESFYPSCILVVANIILGMCSCMYYTLGFAYLDDNSSKNSAPFILALVFCIRLVGPTIGFSLASKCLQFFIDPTLQLDITVDDPRWLGAWWMGWIPLGIFNFILAIFMSPFPKQLPNVLKEKDDLANISKGRSMKDFTTTIRRLLKNKVLMYNSISSSFYLFGVIGYWSFMPKYFETQYQQSASTANLITGSVGLACTALGVLSSGAVISYFKPSPRFLAAWNVFVELLDVIGHISYAFIGCSTDNLQGSWDLSGKWDMTLPCNSHNVCEEGIKYNPRCSDDGSTTFFSPCHAGCVSEFQNGSMVYTNCSCSLNGIIKKGVCPSDCNNNFIIFLAILCTLKFFSATGRSGNTIIQFRAVNSEDKSVSIALTEVMVATFALIPGPIIYGYMMDTTCLAWGNVCGEPGNCWLYEGQRLRFYLNFTAAALVGCAVLADIMVWKNVKGMNIYEDKYRKQSQGSTIKAPELIPFVEH